MLNRFLKAKQDAVAKPKDKRPFLTSEVTSVAEAERWRMQVVREIGKEVAQIQDGLFSLS